MFSLSYSVVIIFIISIITSTCFHQCKNDDYFSDYGFIFVKEYYITPKTSLVSFNSIESILFVFYNI